ncbi:sensor histidine kinase [Streptomyces sp. NRRL F-2664]|uniref:sensor histidine kinase n=1 Tax=Streptomyces sp. NRRL F-2664 TaxID=1463842 RepID=UPI000D13FA47|nr:ATP-binding protein [Streptomyces sp. NRRL F-2664]
MKVYQIGGCLRLGFAVIVTLVVLKEGGEWHDVSLAEAFILATYGLATLAGFFWLFVSASGSGERLAIVTIWFDITVVIILLVLSEGSPALGLALFLVPIFAAFQMPVRHVLALAIFAVTSYSTLMLLDPLLRLRSRDENASAMLSFLVLTCAACVVVARLQQDRSSRISDLMNERAWLLAEVISTEERERAALAERLHDGPLQSVLAVRFELQAAMRERNAGVVAGARDQLLAVSRSLRDLTCELHPSVIEANGIAQSLELLVRSAADRAGIEGYCKVDVQPTFKDPREPIVFNATRELVNNVVRHSGGTKFWVRLAEADGVWRLRVSDNGRGVAADALQVKLKGGHIGLASQRIRVEAANGTMLIEPDSERTTIRIDLPPCVP